MVRAATEIARGASSLAERAASRMRAKPGETLETSPAVAGAPAPGTSAQNVGSAHGGFAVALFAAGPVLMVSVFLFVGMLMAGAQGATAWMWIAATGLLGALSVIMGVALTAAEYSHD